MIKRIRGILGEISPYLTGSKASKLRVFNAILKTNATLFGAAIIGGNYDDRNSSIIYSIEVDEDKVNILETLAKAKLTPHIDIQVGFDIYKSKKAIIYE